MATMFEQEMPLAMTGTVLIATTALYPPHVDESRSGPPMYVDPGQAHSLGFLNTSRSDFSLTPFPSPCNWALLSSMPVPHNGCMYSHRAVSGKLINMLSTRAPGVRRPKLVPLSFTRLNSTYRPRLICCQSLCSGR